MLEELDKARQLISIEYSDKAISLLLKLMKNKISLHEFFRSDILILSFQLG